MASWRVEGLSGEFGFRIQFKVWGLGFRVLEGLDWRVRAWGLVFRVLVSVFRFRRSGLEGPKVRLGFRF